MRYIYMLPAAFLAPVIHEWVKALCSTALGDHTPRNTGHLTLNPFRYFEPIGFVFILLFGFGWGNPTPTAALHYKNRQTGTLITYLVPVLVNLLLGIGAAIAVSALAANVYGPMHYNSLFIFIGFSFWTPNIYFLGILMLSHFAFININMALFSIIPVYPLAANKLVQLFGRPDTIARVNHYEKPMQIILILLLAFGLIGQLFFPITRFIIGLAWGIAI